MARLFSLADLNSYFHIFLNVFLFWFIEVRRTLCVCVCVSIVFLEKLDMRSLSFCYKPAFFSHSSTKRLSKTLSFVNILASKKKSSPILLWQNFWKIKTVTGHSPHKNAKNVDCVFWWAIHWRTPFSEGSTSKNFYKNESNIRLLALYKFPPDSKICILLISHRI